MRKFKNKKTGAILVPNTKFTIEQMEKSDLYVEIKGNNSTGPDKKTLTVADIKTKLEEAGIEYPEDAKKDELIALLPKE